MVDPLNIDFGERRRELPSPTGTVRRRNWRPLFALVILADAFVLSYIVVSLIAGAR